MNESNFLLFFQLAMATAVQLTVLYEWWIDMYNNFKED